MDEKSLQNTERALLQRARMLEQKKHELGTKRKRIGIGMDLVAKLFAVTLDIGGAACNLIPFIGGVIASFVSIVGNIIFAIYYLFLGIKPTAGKSVGSKALKRSLVVRILCFFFELIPYVNMLPGFSIAVWYTSGVVRKEDREYNKNIKKVRKEIAQQERILQRDMQQFAQLVEESRSNTLYEEAVRNQIDEEDEESLAA